MICFIWFMTFRMNVRVVYDSASFGDYHWIHVSVTLLQSLIHCFDSISLTIDNLVA
jgi:hypothetical protein